MRLDDPEITGGPVCDDIDRPTGPAHPGDAARVVNTECRDREPRRARILKPEHIERAFAHVRATNTWPFSGEAALACSVYAGMRVGEISKLSVDAFVDADGQIKPSVTVGRHIAKGGREREIPIHPELRKILQRFRAAHPDQQYICFSSPRGSRRKIRRQSTSALKQWFSALYRHPNVGLRGCSSHSGRRTFLTDMARLANRHGKSLRDVQRLAGHARLETTAAYIDPSEDLSDLVAAFGAPPKARSKRARRPAK